MISAIAVLLLLSFSTRPPWLDPPVARAALHQAPTLHVNPQDRIAGWVDGVTLSGMASAGGARTLEAKGWAASCVVGVPLKSVAVLMDGKSVGETSILSSRPDVAAAYARQDFEQSGWSITVPLSGLSLEQHVVTVRGTLADGSSYQIAGPKFVVR